MTNRMDDSFVQMSLAVLDDVVLGDPTLSIAYKVLMGEAVGAAHGTRPSARCRPPGMWWRVARFVHMSARVNGIGLGRAQHRQRRQRSNKQHFVRSFMHLWLTLFPQEFPGVCHLRMAR